MKGPPPITPPRAHLFVLLGGTLLAGVGAVVSARADEALCLDGPSETARAVAAERGDVLVLSDGRRVRLAGVEVPPPSLADPDGEAARAAVRLATFARDGLAARIGGRDLRLLDLGEDRHGRRRGHLVDTEGGHWLNGDLVGEGRLRVAPDRDDPICAAALLIREAEARAAGRGLWSDPSLAVRRADRNLLDRVGDVVVAEGIVRSIGRSHGRTWLNFGDDIARDFAVVMNDNDRVRFERAGVSWDWLKDRRIRIRGIVSRRGDAPRMAVDDPAALEPLER